jgi:hypothetical protein
MSAAKNAVKSGLRGVFDLGQRVGINILPMHFYSSTPGIRALRHSTQWRKPFAMIGVRGAELPQQIEFLEDLCPPTLIAQWPTLDVHCTAYREQGEGGGYGPIEADVLHAFVRRHRPRKIVQVGCGVSTSVILRAASLVDYKPEIICIEPYPSAFLSRAHGGGAISLINEGAETVPLATLTALERGDMLFVDATHTVKPGSEVNRIILDVLPRLDAGVFVHFHDIYFPYDYQRGLLSSELFFSAESTLLHAFLINNSRCRILLSLSMLHYGAPDRMKALFPHYEPQSNVDGLTGPGGRHFPNATYLLTLLDA